MFDVNKVMWTSEELDAGAAADRIYEKVAEFVKEHSPFGIRDVPALLGMLAGNAGDLLKLINYLFSGGIVLGSVLDRLKDLVCLLERDNDWLGARE